MIIIQFYEHLIKPETSEKVSEPDSILWSCSCSQDKHKNSNCYKTITPDHVDLVDLRKEEHLEHKY